MLQAKNRKKKNIKMAEQKKKKYVYESQME